MRLPSSLRLKESRHFQRVREKGVSHPGRFLVLATLRDDEILDLVGGLVMRLIKRGRGLYGRFHDYNLADLILRTALGRKPITEVVTAKTEPCE